MSPMHWMSASGEILRSINGASMVSDIQHLSQSLVFPASIDLWTVPQQRKQGRVEQSRAWRDEVAPNLHESHQTAARWALKGDQFAAVWLDLRSLLTLINSVKGTDRQQMSEQTAPSLLRRLHLGQKCLKIFYAHNYSGSDQMMPSRTHSYFSSAGRGGGAAE